MNDETVLPDWPTTGMAPGGGDGPARWAHLSGREQPDVGGRRQPEDLAAVAVDGEHLAGVSAGQHVVQRGEAELGRMARRPDHDDAPGFEEGLQVHPASSTKASTATGTPPAT